MALTPVCPGTSRGSAPGRAERPPKRRAPRGTGIPAKTPAKEPPACHARTGSGSPSVQPPQVMCHGFIKGSSVRYEQQHHRCPPPPPNREHTGTSIPTHPLPIPKVKAREGEGDGKEPSQRSCRAERAALGHSRRSEERR